MATERIQTGVRLYEPMLDKLAYIAKKNHRSLNGQFEHLAQLCIDEYEAAHGEIVLKAKTR